MLGVRHPRHPQRRPQHLLRVSRPMCNRRDRSNRSRSGPTPCRWPSISPYQVALLFQLAVRALPANHQRIIISIIIRF